MPLLHGPHTHVKKSQTTKQTNPKTILVNVYLNHEYIWVWNTALHIWLSKAIINLRSPGETFCDARRSGCSFAATEDLLMIEVDLRKLLAQPHGWYLLRNQQTIHVDKVCRIQACQYFCRKGCSHLNAL